jgi:hypothetical protein
MLKYSIITLCIFLGFTPSLFSQDSIKTTLIFYYESNVYASETSYPIYQDDTPITKLLKNTFFEFNCPPGIYTFYVKKLTENAFRKFFEEGRTYYFKIDFEVKGWKSEAILVEVDSIRATRTIAQNNMYNINIPKSYANGTKNSLGLNLNFGSAINPVAVLTLNNGEESTIGFGGGYTLGIQYAYRFDKKLDLAVDINYQFSSLSPDVDNASVSFGRLNIWATPSLYVPLNKRGMLNLKLGAGLNYNFVPTLKFDFTELGSIKDTWKYKEALGYHVQIIFQFYNSDLLSLDLGLRYVGVKYEFKSGGFSYPSDISLQKPDGSAIDLLMGIAFHF